MSDVSATEAARHFADLLDAVERGDRFTIVRRGRAIASLEPLHRGRGSDVKALLDRRRPDEAWIEDLRATRRNLVVEERS